MAESLGVPADLLGYESPRYSQAKEDAKASQEADEKLDPIREMVASFKQEQHDRLLACIPKDGQLHSEPTGEGPPSSIGVTYDPWTDTVSRVVRTDETGKVIEDYIANARTAGTRGPKSVNNLCQCTNGIVQASTRGQQAMQLFTHGISGKPSSTNRRSYRGPSNRRGVSVFYWL
jgi:hypothetical protein